MRPASIALRLTLALSTLVACGRSPEGLAPATGDGPRVVFDLLAKPLPEIPFPNDIATRYDLDSPTGRRVNASVVAPTWLEKEVREEFNLLDGWGTFAPVTVSFDADVDPLDIRARHLDDDFANDAVYLVNLSTGEPVALDLGRGNFPVLTQNNDKYFLNDQREASSNILYETYAETDANGNGLLDPEEDTDADGIWDRPNTVNPSAPAHGLAADRSAMPDKASAGAEGNDRYRDLLVHYERESRTLIIRPVVPLDQRTTYAVVLTGRIKGTDGKSVRSPFPFVNHAAQTETLRPLLAHLGKGRLAGLSLDDVAYAWPFTTQSVTTDLERIRDGLYGRGPLGWLSERVSDRLEPVKYIPPRAEAPDIETHPAQPVRDAARFPGANVHVLPLKDFAPTLASLTQEAFDLGDGSSKDMLLESYKFVDYLVIGSFRTANFMDDPARPTVDAVFRVNAEKGHARVWARPDDWERVERDALEAQWERPLDAATARLRQEAIRATRDRVWFMMAVPKARPAEGIAAPFPLSIYGHGYTSNRPEMLGFAGNVAKFGVATVAIDSYGHGLRMSPSSRTVIEAALNGDGFGPLLDGLVKGRARDLDNDLVDDTGGDFWVADTFHTRDVVRQSVIDWMQLIRVFHAFGTYEMGDVNGDGKAELAGDFNADGVVDVGGPATLDGKPNHGHDVHVWGQSLGGILAGILPAVEPTVVTAAPTAGGGGLSDIGTRSEQGGVIEAVFLEVMGPFLVGVPNGSGGVDLVYQVQDVNDDRRVPLATFAPGELKAGDRIEAENLHTDDGQEQKRDWAIVGADGRFRLQVAADAASFLDGSPVDDQPIHVGACDPVTPATAQALNLRRPADCIRLKLVRGGEVVRTIDTFEQDAVFQRRRLVKGTPLVALARGFGLKRGTKTLRRFWNLAQTIMDPADPVNYAPYLGTKLLPSRQGNPPAVLVVGTTGDLNVPINTAYTQARAAGLLPYAFDPARDAAFGMSPNDALIRSHATEAIEKLLPFTPVAARMRDASRPESDVTRLVECVRPEDCEHPAVVDVSRYAFDESSGRFLDEGNTHDFGRRVVGVAGGPAGVPRLKSGLRDLVTVTRQSPDGRRVSALVTPYVDQQGHHGFDVPHPSDPFDVDLFTQNLIGRFFQTRGADLRYDLCMHRDGFDRPWLKTTGTPANDGPERDPDAVRVPACGFVPVYPESF